MDLNQLIALAGALGLGSLIGALAKTTADRQLNDKRMLFEARVKAYSGVTARLFNLFLEPDVSVLKDDALIWARLNQLLSETMLMAGPGLSESLVEFKVNVHEFHKALAAKDARSTKLHRILVPLAVKIHTQMRQELHIHSPRSRTV